MTIRQKIPVPLQISQRRTDIDFPAYRYVPGMEPHPIRDSSGHLFWGSPKFVEGETWSCDTQFLYGADLFDARFFWEAHENWEHCWKRAHGAEKRCLQGLIQIAAAILKHHQKDSIPRDRLFAAAQEKLSHGIEIGWDFSQLLRDVLLFFHGGDWPLLGANFPRR